ncbi:MAG: bifunctional aminotransferase class I/II-fold pyridoxal phosphate-dependent enzyme/GNAT family N-acetyltransferase [Myxococcota bacterium]
MEASEFLQVVETLHADARRRGLFFQTAEDQEIRDRIITLNGRELTSFGTCSYLGLEYHPEMIRCVHEAVDRFGTQFASSRGYLSSPWYTEFEERMCRIFDAHVITVQTTTLAHQAFMDVFLTEKDAIVMDHHVHYSVQRAAVLARSVGAHVEVVRHNELERAVDLVRQLAARYRTVWFATDGVTSMYGEMAPVELLQEILDAAPNVRLYIDDAHGMSWAGKHGRGSFLSRMPLTERIVVATSLAKAFAAGGAALVFANREEAERVRMCGGPMVFSGPLQPPLLGAALGSARVHLTDELPALQQKLQERIEYTNQRLREADLPLLADTTTPVRFIRLGLPRVAAEVAERLCKDGFYVNVSMYPAVPMKRGGVRLGITANHTLEQIDALVASLSVHVPAVLREEGITREDLDALFQNAVTRPDGKRNRYVATLVEEASARSRYSAPRNWQRTGLDADPATLVVQHVRTIHDLEPREWDALMGTAGCCSHEAMQLAERCFQAQPRPEHNWGFHYGVVREPGGAPVAATFFTTNLQKDDFLMRAEVSQAVEERRRTDPYFLTSPVLQMGGGLSEGNHLYINRAGPWRAGLQRLLELAGNIHEEQQTDVIILRDLPGDDPEMDEFLLGQGYVKVPNLDSHILEVHQGTDEQFLKGLSRYWRRQVREIMDAAPGYRVGVYGQRMGNAGALPPAELGYLHGLYQNVARAKLRFNAFELPENLLPHLLSSPAWELGVLHLEPSAGGPPEGTPVAFWAAHVHGTHYAPLFCGLDYRYVLSHGAYRQMAWRSLKRAQELGMTHMHLGMDAETEKRRFGARAHHTCLYAQARGDFNATILQQIVAEVGLKQKQPGELAAGARAGRKSAVSA